jgi:hypothetical protein
MIAKKIITSLPREDVQRLVNRWKNIRQLGYKFHVAEKRLGFTFEKLTKLAQPWGIKFER